MHILIVGSEKDERELYRQHLQRGLAGEATILEAESAAEALDRCRNEAIDCVLLHHRHLPEWRGSDSLKDFLGEARPTTATVVLTEDESSGLEALDRGAEDYWVTGSWPSEDGLHRTVRHAAETASLRRKVEQQQQALARSERTLVQLLQYDSLTRLPNRLLFRDRLAHALFASERNRTPAAVMFIGLDNFKAINNSLGHAAGDEVLAEVANRLQVCVRNVDTVARWSGDEFTALLEGMSKPDDAVVVARRMMVALSRPILIGREELYATVSVGIATYPGDGESSEALLKNADAAMSRAKRSGGDHYQLYSSEMNVRVAERLSLRNRLRSALDRNEFVLHYQPQVDFRTGRVITLEALLRWREPEGGLRPPAEFIPLLEETGLIVPVGEWVLREACTQSRRWEEAGLRNVRVAVNLSARQFRQKELSQTVAGIIEEVGLDPDRLELELTESMLMDEENSRRTLGELKAMGLRVSLDDFGTGYSSLGFLRQFPVDSLKIDRAFIRDICEEEQDRAICAAIVALARALNLEVVAEGVETPSQLRLLQNQGCHLVQGFVYARPLPALEIWRWLHERWELDPAART